MVLIVDMVFGYPLHSGIHNQCSILGTANAMGLVLFAGIYFTFVMLICAISVSLTMLVLSVYHQAHQSHSAVVCTPVPHWVCLSVRYSFSLCRQH